MGVAAIVVAAGSGERYGARKQFEDLCGMTVCARSVAAARSVADFVVLVAPPDALGDGHGADTVVAGGATRAASVRAGLAVIPPDADVVVVHDAARPMATAALFDTVVAAVKDGADGAVPGLHCTDAVKLVGADGSVAETLPRDRVVLVQTPQAFLAAALRRGHDAEPDAPDDAAVVESAGFRVVVIDGEKANVKVTTKADLRALRDALGG